MAERSRAGRGTPTKGASTPKSGAKSTPNRVPARGRPPKVDRRQEERSILDSLRRVLRLLRLSATNVKAAAGVSAAQLYILLQLADAQDGASINELAEQTLTDRSSVASVVDRLVAAGLADRKISAEDRRRAEVSITRAGQKVVAKAPTPPTASLVAALKTLSDAELASLGRTLNTLVQAMGLEFAPSPMLFEDPEQNGGVKQGPPRRRK